MLTLLSIGEQIAAHRKRLKLSQAKLSRKTGISRATLDALENGRAGELGFSKVAKLLAALGLELTVRTASSQRPTLDELEHLPKTALAQLPVDKLRPSRDALAKAMRELGYTWRNPTLAFQDAVRWFRDAGFF